MTNNQKLPQTAAALLLALFLVSQTGISAWGGESGSGASTPTVENRRSGRKKVKAVIKTGKTSGSAPLPVVFDGTKSAGEDLDYTWNFGDGSEEEDTPIVQHLFVNPGTYVVRLTVEDFDGNVSTKTKKLSVNNKTLPLQVTQFRFFNAYWSDADYPVRIKFRLWKADIPPGSILTFKIGGNIYGFAPGEEFDSYDPLIITDAAGQYSGEAENADFVRLQTLPGGELRGQISTDMMDDDLDQRINPNKTSGTGTTTFTVFALTPDGTYKVFSTPFNYTFKVRRRMDEGDLEEVSIQGRLTDRDPTAEAEMTQSEKQKAREKRKKEKAKIREAKLRARQLAREERRLARIKAREARRKSRMNSRRNKAVSRKVSVAADEF